jgi:CelD/BcsL family acetyltransferase involved in cellulose biosynthesis
MTLHSFELRRSGTPDRLSRQPTAVGVTVGVAGAVALLLAFADTPLRGAATALVLLGAPGLAATSTFRATSWPERIAVGFAASVIVNVAVAQIMIVTGAWSPRGGVVAVVLLSAGLLAPGLVRAAVADRARHDVGGSAPLGRAGAGRSVASVPPAPPFALGVEVVRPTELGPTERDLWRSMQRRVPNLRNPFLAPEFARAVGWFHDRARVGVLSNGPEIVGFFPFDRQRFGIARPLAAGLTDCQGLVHVPGLELDAKDLLRRCRLAAFEFDHLAEGQPFFQAYATARAASPIVDLSDGYEAYEAHLRQSSAKFLRTTRSKARKLEREVGDLRFEPREHDGDALRQVMSWKSDQYRRTGRADRFARPWIAGLVEHLLSADGTTFAGELSMLYADDQPIAGHFGLRTEQVLVGWFPAYDVRFAKYSPGLIQHLRMAEAAAATGIQYIDLGKGQREYKDAMKTRELMVAEGQVLRPSPAASVYWAVRAPTRTLRNVVLARPGLYRFADRALKHYGRITSSWSPRRETASAHSPPSEVRAAADGPAERSPWPPAGRR